MSTLKALGGYFGLEAHAGDGGQTWDSAVFLQSGRAAIVLALHSLRAKRVHLPFHVCSAVYDALDHLKLPALPYRLTPERGVPDEVTLRDGDVVLCVDYFGLSDKMCDATIARFGAQRVLIDASQALFHAQRPDVLTAYSPRKFVGVGDGGLLRQIGKEFAWPDVLMPADEAGSQSRAEHLLRRAAGDVEGGYAAFRRAEESLADCTPRAMSGLTRALLSSIDFGRISVRRRANYCQLAYELTRHGFVIEPLLDNAVPLCCPVFGVDAEQLRSALAARRIFTPVYWPNTLLPPDDVVGVELRDATLYLPCDQRYDSEDMRRLVEVVVEETEKHR